MTTISIEVQSNRNSDAPYIPTPSTQPSTTIRIDGDHELSLQICELINDNVTGYNLEVI